MEKPEFKKRIIKCAACGGFRLMWRPPRLADTSGEKERRIVCEKCYEKIVKTVFDETRDDPILKQLRSVVIVDAKT